MKSVVLNNSVEMPILGFGVFQIGDPYIFDFDLDASDMGLIATLETGESLFFDHRDPAMVKFLSEATRNT